MKNTSLAPYLKKATVLFLLITVSILIVSTPALAAEANGSETTTDNGESDTIGFICEGENAGASGPQLIFQYVIGFFMMMGLLFGMVFWAAERVEIAALGGSTEFLGGIDGKNAIKKGFMLPIIVYFFDFISEPLFGINISCIVPNP